MTACIPHWMQSVRTATATATTLLGHGTGASYL